MNQIWTTRELVDRGFTHAELARLVRAGSLAKIRPGAYELPTAGTERRPADQHRALILATAAQLGPGAVVSHGSAAVLHRLPTWTDERARVHITRSRGSGARTRRLVQVHGATLTPAD